MRIHQPRVPNGNDETEQWTTLLLHRRIEA